MLLGCGHWKIHAVGTNRDPCKVEFPLDCLEVGFGGFHWVEMTVPKFDAAEPDRHHGIDHLIDAECAERVALHANLNSSKDRGLYLVVTCGQRQTCECSGKSRAELPSGNMVHDRSSAFVNRRAQMSRVGGTILYEELKGKT